MLYKYTSCKRVISKVLTDLDLQEGQKRISDMIEWIGEGLEKIGAFPQFIIKTTGRDGEPLLQLVDYQVRLPLGLHNIIQVIYSEHSTGPFYAMRYGSGSFDYNRIEPASTTDTVSAVPTNQIVTTAMSLYSLSYEDALYKINTEPSTRDLVASLITTNKVPVLGYKESGFVKNSGYTYVIQGDYIKANVKDGYLMVAYQSIPLDIDGLPLIPDDQGFIEALYWYIVTKLYYPEWRDGRLRDAVYYEAKRSWNYYSKQAYGNAMMPNIDQLETIKNTWLRLVPNINAHATFFSSLAEPEKFYKL
jgi:hypothetical protein